MRGLYSPKSMWDVANRKMHRGSVGQLPNAVITFSRIEKASKETMPVDSNISANWLF